MPSTVIIETFDAFLVAEPRGRGTVWFYADGLLGPFFVSPVVYEPWTGLVDWCDLLLDG